MKTEYWANGMPGAGAKHWVIPETIRWWIDRGDDSLKPLRIERMHSSESDGMLTVHFQIRDTGENHPYFACLVRDYDDATDALWDSVTEFERGTIVRAQELAAAGKLPDPHTDQLGLALRAIEWLQQRVNGLPGQSPADTVLAIGDSGQPEQCRRDQTVEVRAFVLGGAA